MRDWYSVKTVDDEETTNVISLIRGYSHIRHIIQFIIVQEMKLCN